MIKNITTIFQRHSLWAFFILTYTLNIAITVTQLYVLKLPQTVLVSILQVLTPTISALVVSAVIGGKAEILKLLSGFTRWRAGVQWYLAAFMFTGIPLIVGLIYMLLGNPAKGIPAGETLGSLLGALGLTFLRGPLTEEAGWRGFALPRLQQRFTALASSLILGITWACWHIPFYFEPGFAEKGMPFPIYVVVVTGLSILFTWIFNNTNGSLVLMVLAHFFFNFSSAFLVQRFGLLPPMLLYMSGGLGIGLITVVVIIVFGPRKLTRNSKSVAPSFGRLEGLASSPAKD
jgi:membrane protease YdiL (CAAX protease family)